MTAVAPTRRPTVLVVDDEPAVLRLFKRILSAEDMLILAERTGTEALAVARRTRLDLVILDVKLPDVSGMAVLRQLRRSAPGLPVVMVSGYGSAEAVRAAMELGAFDYLTKPFDAREIRRVAREALASGVDGPIPLRA